MQATTALRRRRAPQTVEPASVTSLAKPLRAQSVNKGKVWLVFVLGAAGLFSAAVLLENNERFFPAISRANKAMAAGRKAMQARTRQQGRKPLPPGSLDRPCILPCCAAANCC